MEYWLEQWAQQGLIVRIVLIVFAAAALFQILYYWIILGRASFYNVKKHASNSQEFPSVSVIVVVQNNFKNLKKNLVALLQQDYPVYEVVVINSSSADDGSSSYLKVLKEEYKHLKHIDLPNVRTFYAKKKFLLALATKEAANDVFIFTNIDCKPDSQYWIRSVTGKITGKKEMILGYSGFFSTKGLSNKFFCLDCVNASMNFLSLAACGMPYTGTGNNLAYTRRLFVKANGFVSHYNIPYGDDTLFINKNATKKNASIVLDPESITRIQNKMTFRRWIADKKQCRLSHRQYKFYQRFVLTLFPFTRFLFYGTFIAALCLIPMNLLTYAVFGVFALRLVSQLIITKNAMNKFKEKKLLLFAPLFEPFYILLSWLTFLKASLGKKVKM